MGAGRFNAPSPARPLARPPRPLFPDLGPLFWQCVRAGPGVQLSQGARGERGEGGGRSVGPRHTALPHAHTPLPPQVYLILDEFILGGELQETSKRVILERLAELDRIET